jgi:hypothetical protein
MAEPRDGEMPGAVRLRRSAGPFGDVGRNRKRRASKLVAQVGVAAGNRSGYSDGNGNMLDGASVHIHLLKAEHASGSDPAANVAPVAVAVAVADNAHAHVERVSGGNRGHRLLGTCTK